MNDKFKQITQNLKFYDSHFRFQFIEFYSKSEAFKNQPDEFFQTLKEYQEDILFNHTLLYDKQFLYLEKNQSKLFTRTTIEEEKYFFLTFVENKIQKLKVILKLKLGVFLIY